MRRNYEIRLSSFEIRRKFEQKKSLASTARLSILKQYPLTLYLPDFFGLSGACVKAEAAVVLAGFDVDGLDSCSDAIFATRGEVDSLFFGLVAIIL